MFGDIMLWCSEVLKPFLKSIIKYLLLQWKQFWCYHDYRNEPGKMLIGIPDFRVCNKCDRVN